MKFLPALAYIFLSINASGKVPSWVANIGSCSGDEICVVGSGSNLSEATANGRSEIAKFFETKVKVDSNITNTTTAVGNLASEASFSEWNSKTINEQADEVISGLETKKSEEADNTFYVLISLSKSKTEKLFRQKIENLDRENEALFSRNSRFVFPLIMLNLKKRNYYFSRYQLVSNLELKSKINDDQMIQAITHLNSLKMSVVSQKVRLPFSFNHLLEKVFSPLKVVFVSKKANPSFKLRTKLNYADEYFKVEGFKKINIVFKIELMGKSEKVLGRMSTSSVQTARTIEQANEKALDDFETQLRENLDQLASEKIGDVE